MSVSSKKAKVNIQAVDENDDDVTEVSNSLATISKLQEEMDAPSTR